MTWASADGPRSVPSAAIFTAAATVVAPVSSVAALSAAAAQASGTGLLAADDAVATASLRGTFAGVALQANAGVRTRINVKKTKEGRMILTG